MLPLSFGAFGVFAVLPVFWTFPTAFLSGAAAAAGIAVINSVGNLAGFFGPFIMGWLKDVTGNFASGLWAISACALMGMVIVLILRHDVSLEAAPRSARAGGVIWPAWERRAMPRAVCNRRMFMPVEVLYRTTATATGGRDGHAATEDGSLNVKLSTPKELGGGGGHGEQPGAVVRRRLFRVLPRRHEVRRGAGRPARSPTTPASPPPSASDRAAKAGLASMSP